MDEDHELRRIKKRMEINSISPTRELFSLYVININILFFIIILPEHFILNPLSRTIQPSHIRLQHLFYSFIISFLSHLALHKHFIIFYPTLHSCFAITLPPPLSPALTDIQYKP